MLQAVHFRAHARRRVRLSAVLWELETDDSDGRRGMVVDVSLAGACIDCSPGIRTGHQIRLQIAAPTLWDPLVVNGTTVWSLPFEARFRSGVVFNHATERTVRALLDLMGAQDYAVDA